jgi:hypothetical protein
VVSTENAFSIESKIVLIVVELARMAGAGSGRTGPCERGRKAARGRQAGFQERGIEIAHAAVIFFAYVSITRRTSLGISRHIQFRFSGLLKLRSQIEDWLIRQVFITGNRKHLIESEKRIPMIDREAIMRKIDSLPDADLKKISKFLSSLEEKPDTRKQKADALSGVIGICEGPQDLAEKHDSYAY